MKSSSITKVVLLGTGTPNANPDRSGPSVAIVVNDTPYIVDFGPGVVRRATAAVQKGVPALIPENIRIAFVTHLHSDHTTGYADLIFTPWVLGRNRPMEVYGPAGIREMTEHIIAAYSQDIEVRLRGLEPTGSHGYNVNTHEIQAGLFYEDANVTVEAIPVSHGSWPEAYAFKFRTPDKTIVISGDTAPCDALVEAAVGCDILIHEVYSLERFKRQPRGWQAYHSGFHTSSKELAEMASKAEPGLLVLYHQLFWGATEEELLEEVRAGYGGKVVSGKDLDIF